ncbi:MAG: tRNA (adenosine(37)-N6)-dimethylallyltransferase MiaA [Caldilineales bacterium]|nr:tRNA (adenosine(37)-N6)-dimethylallyltransferase MiaA [Caldilineales bacterium]MDW8317449.1 tRNA (adenosine(37)-N6)-dimethylallyltransferase MiaA [Anaerolineae bacterium]
MRASVPPLVAIVGPTAVGKSALALEAAQRLGGEIVSADSRQIYRGMDIGTDKPTPEQRRRVPHHLLDVVEPDQVFTLAQYQRAAYNAIADIHERGRLPLLVGGTGLYVRAVLEGLHIPEVPPDPALRQELEAFAQAEGAQALHARLAALDPDAARRIDPRNVRRVVRALEVTLLTGVPISRLQQASPPPFRVLRIGLTRPRPVLYARIDRRVDAMIEAGLVEEVRRLLEAGYSPSLPALTGLGYRQIIQYLQGELSLAEAVAAIKQQTRRFVRQQATWFRLDDPQIRWFDLELASSADVIGEVQRWLEQTSG